MIYFICILLFLFYVVIDTFNYFSRSIISKISFFFSGFAILQLSLGILTLSKISLGIYEPISYFTITLAILLGIGYLIYFYWKNKKDPTNITNRKITSNREYFTAHGFSWLIIIVTFIIQLFLTSPNHDSTFYVAISSNFVNSGIYSSTGIQGEIINQYYLSTTSFFLYGTLFQSNIQLGYTILNKIIYLLIIFSTLSLIFDNSKIKNKKFGIILYYIGVIFCSLLFFIEFTGISGGNFSIQTIAVFCFFLSIYYGNCKNIAVFAIPFGAAFFSSTSILVAPILIASGMVYHLIKYGGLSVIKITPFLVVALTFSLLVFLNPIYNSIMELGPYFLIIFYVILIFLSISFFIVMQYIDNRGKFIQTNIYHKLNNQKGFLSLIIAIIVLPILCIIFWWLIPTIGSNPNIIAYNTRSTIIPAIISIVLVIFSVMLWKKERKIYDLAFAFAIFWLFSIIVKIFLTIPHPQLESLNENLSSWRISFTFIGFGRSESLFLFWIFIIHAANNFTFLWVNKKMMVIYPLVLLVPFVAMGAIAPKLLLDVNINRDITLNQKYLNDLEISFLNDINFMNFSKSYVTNAPISSYLIAAVNLTTNISEHDHGWWSLACGRPRNFITPEDFKTRLGILIKGLAGGNLIINSIRGFQITKVDYIFLNKKADFFEEILAISNDFGYGEILDGQNISVLELK